MRGRLLGVLVGVLSVVAVAGIMLPFRAHMSIATTALVLVVPVVAGVVTGGFVAGLVSVVAGFLVYDYLFIPPYQTLSVGRLQNWVAAVVYVVVMVLVARVVSHLDNARAASHERMTAARRLAELSDVLLGDRPVGDLAQSVVNGVCRLFGVGEAALLAMVDGHLEVLASSGAGLDRAAIARLVPDLHEPVALSTGLPGRELQTLALAAAGRPVGLLVLRDMPEGRAFRELLPTIANHVALALERAQLRESAMRNELLEEVDRLRRALVGAVSHDLRTPLATITVASSTLLDPSSSLSEPDAHELYSLIDEQASRLTRLVGSLLDVTRLEAGVLKVHAAPWPVAALVDEALSALGSAMADRALRISVPVDVPVALADRELVVQVLANLIENAHRHAPPSSPITVGAESHGRQITVSVTDHGPGVPPFDRDALFDGFVRFDSGGRAGLGLYLVKTFVEAHGERVWVEEPPGGGARFVFTLPSDPGCRATPAENVGTALEEV